jgi:hypothetical protein
MRTKFSQAKMARAQRAAEVLALIPWISFVGVTGSLAMTNADDESDIDLMLITKGGRLWTSRLASYILLRLAGYPLRKPRNNSEKDKLCLNIWLDENNLAWDSHNRYTAHEIAQIIPLFDRGVFAKFLQNNSWAGEYWPKAYKDQKSKSKRQNTKSSSYLVASSKGKRGSNIRARLAVLGRVIADGVERLAYGMQSFYMKKKITREVVTPGRAIFHPVDMGEWVLKRKKIA